MATNEEMRAWLEEKIARDTEWLKHIENLETLDADETSPSYSETKYNIGIYQAILAALELVTEKICDCDNYKWLIGELGREATFLYIHGLTIENRGSFKFCPYCGKQVIGEPTSAGGEDEKGDENAKS